MPRLRRSANVPRRALSSYPGQFPAWRVRRRFRNKKGQGVGELRPRGETAKIPRHNALWPMIRPAISQSGAASDAFVTLGNQAKRNRRQEGPTPFPSPAHITTGSRKLPLVHLPAPTERDYRRTRACCQGDLSFVLSVWLARIARIALDGSRSRSIIINAPTSAWGNSGVEVPMNIGILS